MSFESSLEQQHEELKRFKFASVVTHHTDVEALEAINEKNRRVTTIDKINFIFIINIEKKNIECLVLLIILQLFTFKK